MAERVCYRLAPRSPFHIGDKGVGLEETTQILHSDTIFSAICVTLALAGENLEDFLNEFPTWSDDEVNLSKEPPFRITSAFPYYRQTYLFPKPHLRIQGFGESPSPKLGKIIKKIKFVSSDIFTAINQAQDVASDLLIQDEEQTSVAEDNLLQSGSVWASHQTSSSSGQTLREKSKNIWFDEKVPRVSVDRVDQSSSIFACGRIWFADHAGLFFLVEYSKPEYRPVVEKALRILGDEGIGGERSVGHGQFSLDIENDWPISYDLEDSEKYNAFTNLSLYWPAEEEVESGILDASAYQLINRRGWVGSMGSMNLRRRGVNFLEEGSVFSKRPNGALVNVKPLDPSPAQNVPHPVWRYGIALSVPCRRPNQQGGN